GHSRQRLELPSLILLSMVPAELEYEGVVVCSKRPPAMNPRPKIQARFSVQNPSFSRTLAAVRHSQFT
ncbi:MAG: hypothetical protein ACETWQ_03145, partial [Phycisphaerae bacterium]